MSTRPVWREEQVHHDKVRRGQSSEPETNREKLIRQHPDQLSAYSQTPQTDGLSQVKNGDVCVEISMRVSSSALSRWQDYLASVQIWTLYQDHKSLPTTESWVTWVIRYFSFQFKYLGTKFFIFITEKTSLLFLFLFLGFLGFKVVLQMAGNDYDCWLLGISLMGVEIIFFLRTAEMKYVVLGLTVWGMMSLPQTVGLDHVLQLQVEAALQPHVDLETVPLRHQAQLGQTVWSSKGGIYAEYRLFLPPKNRFW